MSSVHQGDVVRARVAELTSQPIVAVLNTHYHLDHTHGNPAFPHRHESRVDREDACAPPGTRRRLLAQPAGPRPPAQRHLRRRREGDEARRQDGPRPPLRPRTHRRRHGGALRRGPRPARGRSALQRALPEHRPRGRWLGPAMGGHARQGARPPVRLRDPGPWRAGEPPRAGALSRLHDVPVDADAPPSANGAARSTTPSSSSTSRSSGSPRCGTCRFSPGASSSGGPGRKPRPRGRRHERRPESGLHHGRVARHRPRLRARARTAQLRPGRSRRAR